ncbi:MAG: carbon starvation protein A [Eubacteriales bacterium]|nr:carbon starvation protein A [Eubacteriales bacterium]
MNAALLLILAAAALICGYMFYGKWLEKTWGIDPDRPTPAHELEDGVDYVPAKTPVLMGHHFSSIAGAGPINGPIQAAVFGWVPVVLWVLVGGIFFGAVHDFGALFASVRHRGQSIGVVIEDTMGKGAKRLFIFFAYLTLLLVVAAFSSIVASTFGNTNAAGAPITGKALAANETTAMISLLFIVLAIIFGILVYRKNTPLSVGTAIGIVGICVIVALGLNWHPLSFSYNVWMVVIGAYILIASVTPVWILLQPRDYLSSFLLYFMMGVAAVGIIGSAIMGKGAINMPAFNGWSHPTSNGLFTTGTIFPALFITIACGAISGFHSLVSSGTTAKQIDNESNARPIGYGAMLIESLLAVISVCAISFVWKEANAGAIASPTAVFALGISEMVGTFVPSAHVVNVTYSMLVLAVSVFCLTSLDTSTRLARYMFQEFWLEGDETPETVTGFKKVLVNPVVATLITVVIGVSLGLTGYTKIWPLFGASNQLLAAIGLLAVCTWLGKIGRNNKMFYIPMVFMLVVTLTSLSQTIIAKAKALGLPSEQLAALGTDKVTITMQLVLAVLLVVCAVLLAITAFKTLVKQHAEKKAGAAQEA